MKVEYFLWPFFLTDLICLTTLVTRKRLLKSIGRHQDLKCKPFEVIKESEINWTETYHDIKCITYLHCFLKGRNAQVSFAVNQQMKINSLNKQNMNI